MFIHFMLDSFKQFRSTTTSVPLKQQFKSKYSTITTILYEFLSNRITRSDFTTLRQI